MRNGFGAGLLLLLATTLASANTTFGPIHVRVDAAPTLNNDNFGYAEYTAFITNRSPDRAYRVTLILPANGSGGREDILRDMRRTVDVPAAEGPKQADWTTVRVSLFQPSVPGINGNQMAVDIDGRRQDEWVTVTIPSRGRNSSGRMYGYMPTPGPGASTTKDGPAVLLSQNIGVEFERRLSMIQDYQLILGGTPDAPPPPPKQPPPPGGPAPRLSRPIPPMVPDHEPPIETPPRPLTPPPSRHERLRVPPRLEANPVGWHLDAWLAGALLAAPISPPTDGPILRYRTTGRPISPQYHRITSDWSPHWLGYTRYAGVVLPGAELLAVAPDVRTALFRYAESGGTLVIVGPVPDALTLPTSWQPFALEAKAVGFFAGLGQAFVLPQADYLRWSPMLCGLVVNAWENTGKPWQHWVSVMNANRELPVVQDLGVPIGGLFALMVGFAIVIGPLNLWVLTRYKKRIWLLVTAPIISLITCVSVFGVMILLEGWDGHLRSSTFTLLDESTLRTQTIGWTSFYSPLTPSDGLRFGYDVELQLQIADDSGSGHHYGYRSRSNSGGTSRTINWTNDQHLNSGWVSARVPTHFQVRKSDQQRRERVTITRTGGTVKAVNALGVPVSELWYADAEGTIYHTEAVAAGAEATLTPTGTKLPAASERVGALRKLFISSQWNKFPDQLSKKPEDVLAPRSYLAVLSDDPFLEDGLKAVRDRQRQAVVLGLQERTAP